MLNKKQILSVPGVSPLLFKDESLFRVAFPKDAVYYARSWLYVLRASHMEGGELGYKFFSPELVAVIGYRNGFIYVTPILDTSRGIRLRRLCDALINTTGYQVILKKLLPGILDPEISSAQPSTMAVPMEDDTVSETIVELKKIFVDDAGTINPVARRLYRKVRAFSAFSDNLTIINEVRQAHLSQIEQFLARWPSKRDCYMPMMRYLCKQRQPLQNYRCRIFMENSLIKGIYVVEKMSLSEAGLYCGVTSKDQPGLTEWMDVYFFRQLLHEGLRTIYLGGSERHGIAHFCSKFLPHKAGYSVQAMLYQPVSVANMVATVRLATEYDITPLAELYRRAYNFIEVLGESWTKSTAHKFVSHFYRRQPDLFFVAEVDGKIVGAAVAAIQPWWDGNHLVEGEIFIEPQYSDNKTIEKSLLKRLLLTARSRHKVVAWDTLMPTVDAHTFGKYESIGFREMPHVKAISADMSTMLARLEE